MVVWSVRGESGRGDDHVDGAEDVRVVWREAAELRHRARAKEVVVWYVHRGSGRGDDLVDHVNPWK